MFYLFCGGTAEVVLWYVRLCLVGLAIGSSRLFCASMCTWSSRPLIYLRVAWFRLSMGLGWIWGMSQKLPWKCNVASFGYLFCHAATMLYVYCISLFRSFGLLEHTFFFLWFSFASLLRKVCCLWGSLCVIRWYMIFINLFLHYGIIRTPFCRDFVDIKEKWFYLISSW